MPPPWTKVNTPPRGGVEEARRGKGGGDGATCGGEEGRGSAARRRRRRRRRSRPQPQPPRTTTTTTTTEGEDDTLDTPRAREGLRGHRSPHSRDVVSRRALPASAHHAPGVPSPPPLPNRAHFAGARARGRVVPSAESDMYAPRDRTATPPANRATWIEPGEPSSTFWIRSRRITRTTTAGGKDGKDGGGGELQGRGWSAIRKTPRVLMQRGIAHRRQESA